MFTLERWQDARHSSHVLRAGGPQATRSPDGTGANLTGTVGALRAERRSAQGVHDPGRGSTLLS
jgi:hypothetical protein